MNGTESPRFAANSVDAVALADLFKHIGYTQVITISPICYHEMDLKSLS